MNINYKDREKRFNDFTIELGELSKKYGIMINSTGGVNIYNKEEISTIKEVYYSNDYTSGDLSYEVLEK